MPILLRASLGFIAAALSVLVFHQGMVEILHVAGLLPNGPYNLAPMGPLHVPVLADQCFWGGLYGIVFGIAMPSLPRLPYWLLGLGLGLVAAAVGWFVVAPLKGLPLAAGWDPVAMLRSVAINGFWGIGVGIIAPWLIPTRARMSATV
jgi:hypothetical protein